MRCCLRVIVFLIAIVVSAGAFAGVRVALVIGESRYASVRSLSNPSYDAEAMAASFKAIGFQTVVLAQNVTRDQMHNRLAEFAQVAAEADWAVVYFAGHGMEVGGRNYLIPVDARIVKDTDLATEAIDLDSIVAATSGAKALRLIILDACRDNPFLSLMRNVSGMSISTVGLGNQSATSSSALIAYAAGEGLTAYDGEGNSPFVAAMVKHIRTPGLEVDGFFRLVRDDVLKATAGRQEPHVYGSLSAANKYLVPPEKGDRIAVDEVAWDLIKDSSDSDIFHAFVEKFGDSPFRASAEARIDGLNRDRWRMASNEAAGTKNVVRRVVLPGAAAKPQRALRISCGVEGIEFDACLEGVRRWSKKTGVKVNAVPQAKSYTDRSTFFRDAVGKEEPDFDIIQTDIIWSGAVADKLADLKPYFNGGQDVYFSNLIDTGTVDGRLVAVPWYVDTGLLYYRRDLMAKYAQPVPTTWEQVAGSARIIQAGERQGGNARFWGFVFSGGDTEGLTCFIIELSNAFGFTFLSQNPQPLTDQFERLREAVAFAAGLIGDVSPTEVLGFNEEAARQYFQDGNAAFMRNWPYAIKLAEEDGSALKGKVGVIALPKGGSSGNRSGTLGGWQLAIPAGSPNKALAADLIAYLTSSSEAKRRAIAYGYAPAIGALYRDPRIIAANPVFPDLFIAITNASARPSQALGAGYDAFSGALRGLFRAALRHDQTVDESTWAMFMLR